VLGRVWVTGAQGLLGRHVVAALLATGADAVLGLGRSPRLDGAYTHDLEWLGRRVPAPLPPALHGVTDDARYDYATLDVRDRSAVTELARRLPPEAVIHTAAALRDASWTALYESNVQATFGLLTGLAAAGSPRLVLTSSGSVYGAGGDVLPFAEDGPAEPIELYGASKRAGEDVARLLARDSGLPLVQARVFNLVGPGLQDRHLPAVLAAKVAALTRHLAPPVLALGGPLTATRDFIDVGDAARALVLLAGTPSPAPLYNIASGAETPVQAVLDTLLDLGGLRDAVDVQVGAGRPADVPRAYADVSRLRGLGFRPARELSDTLAGMLGYFDTFPLR